MSKLARRSAALTVLAALLVPACVIGGSDDDAADTSGNTTNTTASSTTASTTNTTAGTGDSSGTTLEPSTSDASSSSVGDTTAADSTGNAGACGWGPTGEKTTPFGYICGGDGEDPDGNIAIACPIDVALVDQGDCGGNMGITGAGCCDPEGNVWFCADDDANPRLFTEDC